MGVLAGVAVCAGGVRRSMLASCLVCLWLPRLICLGFVALCGFVWCCVLWQYFLFQRRKRQALISSDNMLSLNVPLTSGAGSDL